MQAPKEQNPLVEQYYQLRGRLERLYNQVDYLELEVRQLEFRILDAGLNVSEPDARPTRHVSPK